MLNKKWLINAKNIILGRPVLTPKGLVACGFERPDNSLRSVAERMTEAAFLNKKREH
jgi:hypothetical protein